MYNYEFKEVTLGALSGKPKESYEDIIQKYASEGYRLHTFCPLPIGAGGQALKIQLIFEKEIK